MWFLVLLVLALLLAVLAYASHRRYSYWLRRGIPHGKPTFPLGNMSEWPKKQQFSMIFKDYYNKYKSSSFPFVGFYFIFKRAIVVTDLNLVKDILIKDFNNFESRGIFFNEVDDPLTANLFALEGQQWRQLRHKLSPTFTSGKMKFMFPTIVAVAKQLTQVFENQVRSADKKSLEVTNLVARFTADVIGTCAFGLECNSLHNPTADFVVTGRRALVERAYANKLDILLFGLPKLARKLRLRSMPKDISKFYMDIVRDTIDSRKKNNIKRNDFMDMLIELKDKHDAGNTTDGISFEELAAQAFIFFLAGFETSSSTLGFALYELARHQTIQDQLRTEINTVLTKHNNEFTYEALKEMEFLEQVVDETLRMYPILGHLVRATKNHYQTENSKHYIEAGTTVLISALGIHYDPDIYPEPDKFKPERFTSEEIKARPACTWLPFGDGPRNCIGMRFGKIQTTVGLATLIKNFTFSIAPDTQIPMKFARENILLSPLNGTHLKVEKIDN